MKAVLPDILGEPYGDEGVVIQDRLRRGHYPIFDTELSRGTSVTRKEDLRECGMLLYSRIWCQMEIRMEAIYPL